MNQLIVSSVTPTTGSGTGLRTYGVAAALARRQPVEIAYIAFGQQAPAGQYEGLADVTMRPLHASRGFRRGVQFARAIGRGIPVGVARGISPALASVMAGVSADTRVIADAPVAAAALLPYSGIRDLVYLAHNLESSGFRGDSESLARFERRVLRAFSECWMATRADERGARALAGDGIRTRYVPNVIDVTRITPVPVSGGRRLLFVGDFRYRPNVEALGFLIDEVLPILWETMPDVRLSAVGANPPDVGLDRRVETPGFVGELGSAYGKANVVVVPLLRGGGSPLKFVEALAYGLPVVATRHAAALIEDGVPGRDFLAADDPRGFADSIASMLVDAARADAIGRAGRALVECYYSVDHLAALLSS